MVPALRLDPKFAWRNDLIRYEFSRNVHASTEGMPFKLCQHPRVGQGTFKKIYDLHGTWLCHA